MKNEGIMSKILDRDLARRWARSRIVLLLEKYIEQKCPDLDNYDPRIADYLFKELINIRNEINRIGLTNIDPNLENYSLGDHMELMEL